jgi:hypothetical protein
MALSQISLRLENLSQAFVEAWKLDLAAGLLGVGTEETIMPLFACVHAFSHVKIL